MFLEYAKNKVWLPVPDFKIFTRQDINLLPSTSSYKFCIQTKFHLQSTLFMLME